MTWRCSRYFWIRSAGFPCSWLDDLALQESRPAHSHWIERDDADTGAAFERAFAEETAARRRLLLERMSDPLVREALYLSNRDALKRIRALCEKEPDGALDARSRQHLRLAWSYLQRFCSKNDTASFFGPIAWGRFSTMDVPLEARSAPGSWLRTRRVFFEHWAVQRLADAISEDPEVAPFLPLSVNPGCSLEGDRLHYPIGRSVLVPRLAGDAIRIVASTVAGGQRAPRAAGPETWPMAWPRTWPEHWTERSLAARLAEETGNAPQAILEMLAMLRAKGVLSRRIVVPTAMDRPEAVVAEALAALPDECPGRATWRERFEELLALRRDFEGAGLDERARIDGVLQQALIEGCGTNLEREKGKMYVGRYVLYEDCGRNLDLELSDRLREELEQGLSPVLDAFRGMAAAVAAALEARWAEAHRALAGPDGAVDFLRFHQHVRTHVEPGEIVAALRERLREAWAAVLPSAPGDEVHLSAADLQSFADRVAGWPDVEAQARLPLGCEVHSPDLMIAARSLEDLRAGRYQVILGEIHPGIHAVSQPVAQPFCPFVPELLEEIRQLLAPASLMLVDPPQSHHRSNLNWLDCDALYELVPPGCASRLPPERQIAAGRARVVADGPRLRCVDGVTGLSGDLLTLMPGAFHRAAFELARDVLGGDYPARLVSGRLVLKRRTWLLRPGALPKVERPGEVARSFAALHGWAREQGMPRWVFLASDREPKPVFVDFQSPMALDLFYKLAQQATRARVSEMRPSPEELWLQDERGSFTCELRTTFFRPR